MSIILIMSDNTYSWHLVLNNPVSNPIFSGKSTKIGLALHESSYGTPSGPNQRIIYGSYISRDDITSEVIYNAIEKYLVDMMIKRDTSHFHVNPNIKVSSFYSMFKKYGHLMFKFSYDYRAVRQPTPYSDVYHTFTVTVSDMCNSLFKVDSDGNISCILEP